MNYIGIDHGKYGAIGVVNSEGEVISFIDLPHIGGELDLDAVCVFIKKFEPYKLGLEEVVSIFKKMKATDILTFAKNYGKLIGFLYGKEIPFELVHARAWKKEFKLTGKPKECSVAEARQRWPQLKPNLPITKDGRAEALLIAEWTRRKLK